MDGGTKQVEEERWENIHQSKFRPKLRFLFFRRSKGKIMTVATVTNVVKGGKATPRRFHSRGREIPPMAELPGKRLKTSQSFVKVSEKQPYDGH